MLRSDVSSLASQGHWKPVCPHLGEELGLCHRSHLSLQTLLFLLWSEKLYFLSTHFLCFSQGWTGILACSLEHGAGTGDQGETGKQRKRGETVQEAGPESSLQSSWGSRGFPHTSS